MQFYRRKLLYFARLQAVYERNPMKSKCLYCIAQLRNTINNTIKLYATHQQTLIHLWRPFGRRIMLTKCAQLHIYTCVQIYNKI